YSVNTNARLDSCWIRVELSATRRSARDRADKSDAVEAKPNSPMAAARSELVGVTPAFANSVSTKTSGDIEVGYAEVNRARCTKSAANTCLLFSRIPSHPL